MIRVEQHEKELDQIGGEESKVERSVDKLVDR